MPRLAANLSMLFTELPFLERFQAAADAGFRAVECQFPYEADAGEIKMRLDACGLEQVLINAPAGDWDAGERGLAGVPGAEARFRESVEQAIAYALVLRCPRIHFMAGVAPLGLERDGCLETLAQNLQFAAGACEGTHMEAMTEPINPTDMPGYLVKTLDHALEVIGRAAHPNLFIQFDAYHAAMVGADPLDLFHRHRDVIRHVQVAGVPGRHEPEPGGAVDWPAFFALLDTSGYEGFVGCEYRPRTGSREGLAWAKPYGVG